MSRLGMTATALFAVSLALALFSFRAGADFRLFASPGPVSKSHASIENNCDACHVPYKGIPNTACLQCHKKTEKRIKDNVGPHAAFEHDGKRCIACHKDHKGRDHRLSPDVPADFNHASAGFALTGAHAKAACAGCHKAGVNGPKWIDLPTTCIGCHEKNDAAIHKGALGKNCQGCHSTTSWKPAIFTIADHKVSMSGGHANVKCETCHQGGAHLTRTFSCGDCHEQKHGGTKAPCATCHNTSDWHKATFTHDFCTCILPGKHQTAKCVQCHPNFQFNPTPLDCAGCHEKDRPHDKLGACARCHSALSFKAKAFDHDKKTVFPLTGMHLDAGCENCHVKKNVFKGLPTRCEGCHKVPEHGDFGACAQCHTTAGFAKTTFSHAKTRFPLDGSHEKVACQTCHSKFKTGQFVPGKNECVLCHQSPHGEQFKSGHPDSQPQPPRGEPHSRRPWPSLKDLGTLFADNGAIHVVSPGRGCLDCHDTKAWTPSTVDEAKHAAFGFTLKGMHKNADCQQCHASGRFAGTPKNCNECHNDRHRGHFGDQCTKCHDESGWKHHPGFSHLASTGFDLKGPHAVVACAKCHGDDGARLENVKDVGCATCHTPSHGLQFGRDCESCHRLTTQAVARFSDVPPFDHDRTHFPLERAHRAVPCTTCHDARRLANSAAKLDPNCRSCHGDPHRGRTTLECEECHRADNWNIVRYDHDKSEFPLRGRHFVTTCRECHTNDVWTGLRRECIACHRGDRLRADMLHPMDHPLKAPTCGDMGCHKPFAWLPAM